MKVLLAMAFLFVSGIVQAKDHDRGRDVVGVELGNPDYGGSGCPDGSVAISLSPDKSVLSLLFDRFMVEAGGKIKKLNDRSNCNIKIPVKVPDGMQLAVYQIDLRGFASLPDGAQMDLNVRHELPVARGMAPVDRNDAVKGPYEGDVFFSLPLGKKNKSRCGGKEILKANLELIINASKSQGRTRQILKDSALAAIDTADVSRKPNLAYYLALEPCR